MASNIINMLLFSLPIVGALLIAQASVMGKPWTRATTMTFIGAILIYIPFMIVFYNEYIRPLGSSAAVQFWIIIAFAVIFGLVNFWLKKRNKVVQKTTQNKTRKWHINTILLFICFGIIITILIVCASVHQLSTTYTKPIQIGYIIELISGIVAFVASYLATKKIWVRWTVMLAILLFLIGRWVQLGVLFS